MMHRRRCQWLALCLLLAIFPWSPSWASSSNSESTSDLSRLFISGFVLDSHRDPVKDARIRVRLDGRPHEILVRGKRAEEAGTGLDGAYLLEIHLPKAMEPDIKFDMEIRKASFMTMPIPLTGTDFAKRGENYFLHKDVSLPRFLGPAFWIAVLVLVGVYLLISMEVLHRTLATMLGAAAMLGVSYTFGTLNQEYRILSFQTAMQKIDMNVVLLFMGMMIIVGILKHTGLFQWAAFKCFQLARGRVMVLSLLIMLFTALTSTFLDNVTTMLLLTPVTIAISQSLRINPLTLLIPEVMAANVGGAATLIGDPPNMMIGSYANLTFVDFLSNLAPICGMAILVLLATTAVNYWRPYREVRTEDVDACIQSLREEYGITDKTLLAYGLGVFSFTIFLFVTQELWQMKASIAALLGASVLLTYAILTKRVRLLDFIEKDVEWPTLLFFVFLFVLVGAVEETGLLAMVGDWVVSLSQGNLTVAICLVLWVSTLVSAFVDNIPYTATMLPVVAYLTQTIPGAESNVLWWAFALGTCLGGNGTVIGGSANVVTMGMAESVGYPISFLGFMRFGLVYMLLSVGMCNLLLLLFY